jgi:hypothetical protein
VQELSKRRFLPIGRKERYCSWHVRKGELQQAEVTSCNREPWPSPNGHSCISASDMCMRKGNQCSQILRLMNHQELA